MISRRSWACIFFTCVDDRSVRSVRFLSEMCINLFLRRRWCAELERLEAVQKLRENQSAQLLSGLTGFRDLNSPEVAFSYSYPCTCPSFPSSLCPCVEEKSLLSNSAPPLSHVPSVLCLAVSSTCGNLLNRYSY